MEILACDPGNANGKIAMIQEGDQDVINMFPTSNNLDPAVGMPTEAFVTPPTGDPIQVFRGNKSVARLIRRDPKHGVREIKTHLADDDLYIPDINQKISPYRIYSEVVKAMVELANQRRAEDRRTPVYQLVLTYPSAFCSYKEKELTILNRMVEAVEEMEIEDETGRHHLEVVGRLPEPAAVSIDYLHFLQSRDGGEKWNDEKGFTVLACDIGCGTFDTAVVTAYTVGKAYDVWKTGGLPTLGGRNFDGVLKDEVIRVLREEHQYEVQDEQEQEILLQEVIQAKHTLSESEEAVIQHQSHQNGKYMEVEITRERFEEISKHLVNEMAIEAQRILDEYIDEGGQVDCIVMSGGASHMPMVRKALEHLEPQLSIECYRPERAVVYGAARYALGLNQESNNHFQMTDPVATMYTQHGYGVLTEKNDSMDAYIRMGVNKGTALPVTKEVENFPTESGRNTCMIYRPKEDVPADAATLEKNQGLNMACLHYDMPHGGNCKLTLRVEQDYNVVVSLTDEDGNVYTDQTRKKTTKE